ncbi:MAG: AsmA family protein, partial [Alphaproteobacteria bacterium]|nr:AsmA family protein [Alphaproteobacteria bacterium]
MSDPRRPGPPPREPYPSFEERAYGAGPGGTQPAATAPPPLHAPPRHHDEQHHAGHHRRPRRKRRSWLASLLFLVLLGSIAVVSAGAVFLITNPPTALIRAQLIDQVKARTGRTLTIAGPTSFTVFPSLGLAMKDVTLSPPPGMTGPAFAKMAELDVSVRLLPLLKREVSINRLVLQKPVIDLRVDKNGAKSWDFAALTTPQRVPVRLAQAPRAASDAPGGLPSDAQDFLKNAGDASKKPNAKKIAELRQLQLGDVRIVDGTVRYADAKSQTRQEVEAVNVRLHLDHIAAPLGAKGDLKWRKEKINFSATLTSLEQVLQTKPAKVTINLISQPVVGSYDGTVHAGDVVAAKGVVALKSPSVRKLAHWLGSELPPAKGYGPLQLSGVLDANGNTTHLTSAKLSLDNQQAQGKITVKTGGVRPYVNANLKLSQLDLNNYLAGGPAPRPVAATQTPTTAKPAPAKKSSAPKSINDLLGDTGTRVKGYTQRSGWSKEAMNAQALGAVDADATLSIGRLFVHNLKIGQSNVQVNLKNRVM